jgi:hypothetical protein
MYGGVQLALGAYYLWASMKEERHHEGLRSALVVLGGMSSSRFLSLTMHGFSAAAGPYGYNIFAVTFEGITSLLALYLLLQPVPPPLKKCN